MSVLARVRPIALGLSVILLVAGLWEVIPRLGWINPELLPPFSATLAEASRLVLSPDFLPHLYGSLHRWAVAFALSLVLSVPAGLAMGRSGLVRDILGPLLTAMYPVPKAALMPIVMLWLGAGDGSKILVMIVGCSIPLVVNSYHGAQGVEDTLIWSARALGTRDRFLLPRIILPAALPEIAAGVRTALGISLFVMLASEMLVRQNGLGFFLFNSLELGLYRLTYATVLLISVIGFALDMGFQVLSRRLLRWVDAGS